MKENEIDKIKISDEQLLRIVESYKPSKEISPIVKEILKGIINNLKKKIYNGIPKTLESEYGTNYQMGIKKSQKQESENL